MTSGIYQIKNLINNKFYIGQTLNIEKRKKQHFQLLELNKHYNNELQNDFNLFGIECFKFELLQEENKFLDALLHADGNITYPDAKIEYEVDL